MSSAETSSSSRVIGERLAQLAGSQPKKRFVWCGDEWLTYAEVDELASRSACGLRARGIGRGDRVAIMLPNRIEYVVLMFACAKLAAVQVPINPFLRGDFLRHQLVEPEIKALVTDALGLDQIAPLIGDLPPNLDLILVGDSPVAGFDVRASASYAELLSSGTLTDAPTVRPSDLYAILYTSGTTGPSKGCMMSHGYFLGTPHRLAEAGWFEPGDAIYGGNPLFHSSGQITLVMTALAMGGAVIIDDAFHASTFMIRARQLGATVTFGMGAMGQMVLAQPPRPDDRVTAQSLRQVILGPPMTESELLAFQDRFGVPVVCEIFGQTECFPATLSHLGGPRKLGSAGLPLSGIEVRIVDDEDYPVPQGESGEIVIRADEPNMMYQGYWNNAEATAHAFRNLWHHTGDFGRFDEEGFLYFVDRKKDSLRRRGESVSSMELEDAIRRHPKIELVAAVGVPSVLGEDDIKVCIIPVKGADLTPRYLYEFFKQTLPYFAVPRYVELMDEFPVTSVGKIQKFRLRERGVTLNTWDFDAMGFVIERHERRAPTG